MDWRDVLSTALVLVVLLPLFGLQFRSERRRNELAQSLRAAGNAAAEAVAAREQRAAVAVVIPVSWDARDEAAQALLVRNFGPESAQQLHVVARSGDEIVTATARFVRPTNDNLVIADVLQDGDDPWSDDPPPRIRSARQAWMRAGWTNPDGTPGDSLWMRVPRRA